MLFVRQILRHKHGIDFKSAKVILALALLLFFSFTSLGVAIGLYQPSRIPESR